MIGWGQTGETLALETIPKLLREAGWAASPQGAELMDAVVERCRADDKAIRFLSRRAVAMGPGDRNARAARLIRLAMDEDDLELQADVIQMIRTLLDPGDRDDLLRQLSDAFGLSISFFREGGDEEGKDVTRDVRVAWACAALEVHLFAGPAAFSTPLIEEIFADPSSASGSFKAAVRAARELFSATSESSARGELRRLLLIASVKLAEELSVPGADPASATHGAADELVQELFFASGAFERSTRPRPGDEQRTRWFEMFYEVLSNLTAVTHPHTVYQLVQTLEYFIDDDPRRVFELVAASLRRSDYFFYESLGVTVVVRIVERYLADHRTLLMSHPGLLDDLRLMLEGFARVGWGEALRLTYTVSDAFR